MSDPINWKARALEAEAQLEQLQLVLLGAVAGAGGRIVIHPHDLFDLPNQQLHQYQRPESGAQVLELVDKVPVDH